MSVDVIHGHAMTLSTMSLIIYKKKLLGARTDIEDIGFEECWGQDTL